MHTFSNLRQRVWTLILPGQVLDYLVPSDAISLEKVICQTYQKNICFWRLFRYLSFEAEISYARYSKNSADPPKILRESCDEQLHLCNSDHRRNFAYYIGSAGASEYSVGAAAGEPATCLLVGARGALWCRERQRTTYPGAVQKIGLMPQSWSPGRDNFRPQSLNQGVLLLAKTRVKLSDPVG